MLIVIEKYLKNYQFVKQYKIPKAGYLLKVIGFKNAF